MDPFGTIIARARRAKKMRLVDLACQIFLRNGHTISIPHLSDLEHHRNPPSDDLIVQFASILDISPDILFFSLGRIPPDLRQCSVSEEQVHVAFVAFRQVLGVPSHMAKNTV